MVMVGFGSPLYRKVDFVSTLLIIDD